MDRPDLVHAFTALGFRLFKSAHNRKKDWPGFDPASGVRIGIGAQTTSIWNHSDPATLRLRPLHRESAIPLRQLRPHLLENFMKTITLPMLAAVVIGGPRVGIGIGPLGFGRY